MGTGNINTAERRAPSAALSLRAAPWTNKRAQGLTSLEQFLDEATERRSDVGMLLARIHSGSALTPTDALAVASVQTGTSRFASRGLRWRGMQLSEEFQSYAARVARGEQLAPFRGQVVVGPSSAFPWDLGGEQLAVSRQPARNTARDWLAAPALHGAAPAQLPAPAAHSAAPEPLPAPLPWSNTQRLVLGSLLLGVLALAGWPSAPHSGDSRSDLPSAQSALILPGAVRAPPPGLDAVSAEAPAEEASPNVATQSGLPISEAANAVLGNRLTSSVALALRPAPAARRRAMARGDAFRSRYSPSGVTHAQAAAAGPSTAVPATPQLNARANLLPKVPGSSPSDLFVPAPPF